MGPGGTAQDITHNDGEVMYLIILGTINYYYYYFCYNYYYYSCKTWPTLKGEGKDKAHSNVWWAHVWGHSTELGLGGRGRMLVQMSHSDVSTAAHDACPTSPKGERES